MASTNKTTNYELSQFLGSDKPAWLSDYNTDMNKIDAQMKVNANAATAAGGTADAATTAIGTLASLTTTAKTDLVSAINEVDSNADTAQSTANSAATTANSAATTANAAYTGLQRFNLTNQSVLSPSTTAGSISNISYVQFATDSTSSIFKVYGRVYVENLANITGSITVTIGSTSLRPSSAYTINTAAIVYLSNGSVVPRNITINTDGRITLTDTLGGDIGAMSIMLLPCLYFNTDFGDQ